MNEVPLATAQNGSMITISRTSDIGQVLGTVLDGSYGALFIFLTTFSHRTSVPFLTTLRVANYLFQPNFRFFSNYPSFLNFSFPNYFFRHTNYRYRHHNLVTSYIFFHFLTARIQLSTLSLPSLLLPAHLDNLTSPHDRLGQKGRLLLDPRPNDLIPLLAPLIDQHERARIDTDQWFRSPNRMRRINGLPRTKECRGDDLSQRVVRRDRDHDELAQDVDVQSERRRRGRAVSGALLGCRGVAVLVVDGLLTLPAGWRVIV